MNPDQESAPINKALMRLAAAVGLSSEEIDEIAKRWKAAHGVDLRKPLPEDMAEDDPLYLTCLQRILLAYKAYKGTQKKRRGSR